MKSFFNVYASASNLSCRESSGKTRTTKNEGEGEGELTIVKIKTKTTSCGRQFTITPLTYIPYSYTLQCLCLNCFADFQSSEAIYKIVSKLTALFPTEIRRQIHSVNHHHISQEQDYRR